MTSGIGWMKNAPSVFPKFPHAHPSFPKHHSIFFYFVSNMENYHLFPRQVFKMMGDKRSF
jgi:hypothetical protein